MRILILDADSVRLTELSAQLAGNGYQIRPVTDGWVGWQLINDQAFDLVVLTAELMGLDGYRFIRQARQARLPLTFLMLGTPGQSDEREAGRQAVPDGFLPRPFSEADLKQIVRELYRQHRAKEPYWLRRGGLALNLTDRVAYRQSQPVSLTERECQLLAILMQYPGHILSKAQLVRRIWGETDGQRLNRVEVHMTNLRKKIDDAFPQKLIQTIVGAGYMLAPLTYQPLTDQPMSLDLD